MSVRDLLFVVAFMSCTAVTTAQLPHRSAVTLGALGGSEKAASFETVGGVAMLPDGRVVVADTQRGDLSIFSQSGKLAFHIRDTAFSSPCCMTVDRQGFLWVNDRGERRYVQIKVAISSAAVIRTVVAREQSGPCCNGALVVTNRSEIVELGSGTQRDSSGELLAAWVYHEPDGKIVRRIEIPRHTSPYLGLHTFRIPLALGALRATLARYFAIPFAASELTAHAPDGEWASVVTSSYVVYWYDASGSLLRTLRRQLSGPAMNGRDSAAARAMIRKTLKGYERLGLQIPIPDHKPPVDKVFFDDQGRLWVQRSVHAGERNLADVYDRSGALIATVDWPADISLDSGRVSEWTALGVQTAEATQYVVRLRFQ